jgi:hypothetical protein
VVLAAFGTANAVIATAADSIGVVQRSYGLVQIERGGSRVPVKAGATLFKGDRIVTDAEGSAEIRMRGVAPLRIGPSANIAVERFATDESTRTGSVSSLFQGLASLFTGYSHHR